MRQEIAAIKAENDHLRKEVRNAVDQEVRHMFATKYKNAVAHVRKSGFRLLLSRPLP